MTKEEALNRMFSRLQTDSVTELKQRCDFVRLLRKYFVIRCKKMGMLKRVVNEALVTRLTSVSSKTHPSSSGLAHLIPKGLAIRLVKIYCPHFLLHITDGNMKRLPNMSFQI